MAACCACCARITPAEFDAPDTGHELAPRGSCSIGPYLAAAAYAAAALTSVDQLWFELTTAAFYHRDRLTWFSTLHRWSMFGNIFFGTGAVASLLQSRTWLVVSANLLLALVSAASLAFDFAGSARKHEDRRRTYHDLAAQLQESTGDDDACKSLRAKMIRAAADDPYVYKAAEAVAYNASIVSLGRATEDEFILTGWERFLRHVRTYSGTNFPQRKECEKPTGGNRPT